MTTTFATILGLFTTGSAPMGLLGAVIALIVGLNFWVESRDSTTEPMQARVFGKIANNHDLHGLPLAPSRS